MKEMPTQKDIEDFIYVLFDCGKIKPELSIIMLVYLQRLLVFAQFPVMRDNWRPLILISTLTAEKVWSDIPLSNKDFSFIYSFFKAEQISRMETIYLNLLKFDVQVSQKLYTQYYFNLRTLTEQIEVSNPLHVHQIKTAQPDEQSIDDFDTRSESLHNKKSSKKGPSMY